MPFGAHETMEVNEILMEKINMLTHFDLYLNQAKNPQLQDIIVRHQQEEIRSYNELVTYTHDYTGFSPIPPNTPLKGVRPQQIQYGLSSTSELGPVTGTDLTDREIVMAILLCHKNAARNSSWAQLECADPNLRKLLMNSAANCSNQAYEVFLFMNEQGLYPVPEMNNQTAKAFLHRYQPAGQDFETKYYGQAGQGAYSGQAMNAGGQGTAGSQRYSNYAGGAQGRDINVTSPQSILYGGSQEAGRTPYPQPGPMGRGSSQSGSYGSQGAGSYGSQNYGR